MYTNAWILFRRFFLAVSWIGYNFVFSSCRDSGTVIAPPFPPPPFPSSPLSTSFCPSHLLHHIVMRGVFCQNTIAVRSFQSSSDVWLLRTSYFVLEISFTSSVAVFLAKERNALATHSVSDCSSFYDSDIHCWTCCQLICLFQQEGS